MASALVEQGVMISLPAAHVDVHVMQPVSMDALHVRMVKVLPVHVLQGLHAAAPALILTYPDWQLPHTALDVAVHAVMISCPAGQSAVHATHVVSVVALQEAATYWFELQLAHDVHAAGPAAILTAPAKHVPHTASAVAEHGMVIYMPAAQEAVHVWQTVSIEDVQLDTKNVPLPHEEHTVQLSALVAVLTVPAAHGEHVASAVEVHAVAGSMPGGHVVLQGTHTVSEVGVHAAVMYLDAAQAEHVRHTPLVSLEYASPGHATHVLLVHRPKNRGDDIEVAKVMM